MTGVGCKTSPHHYYNAIVLLAERLEPLQFGGLQHLLVIVSWMMMLQPMKRGLTGLLLPKCKEIYFHGHDP